MELLGFHWMDCHEISYLRIFLKSVDKLQDSLKKGQDKRNIYMQTNTHFLSYLSQFFLE